MTLYYAVAIIAIWKILFGSISYSRTKTKCRSAFDRNGLNLTNKTR